MTKVLLPLTPVTATFKLTDAVIVGRIVGYNNGQFDQLLDFNVRSAYQLLQALDTLPAEECEQALETLASKEMCYIVQNRIGQRSFHTRGEVTVVGDDYPGMLHLPAVNKVKNSGFSGFMGQQIEESYEDFSERKLRHDQHEAKLELVIARRTVREAAGEKNPKSVSEELAELMLQGSEVIQQYREIAAMVVENTEQHRAALQAAPLVTELGITEVTHVAPLGAQDRLSAIENKLESLGVSRERMAQLLGYLIEPPPYYPALAPLRPADLQTEEGLFWKQQSVTRYATDTARNWVDQVFLSRRLNTSYLGYPPAPL